MCGITSKIFEQIILLRLGEYLRTTDNQFSLSQATQQTSVFMHYLNLLNILQAVPLLCMLHFLTLVRLLINKSSDSFHEIFERNVLMYLIKISCYWYQHQVMSVRWGCSISNVFNVTNRVRQGEILSPKLFNIYIDGLSYILNNSLIGGSFGGNCINQIVIC